MKLKLNRIFFKAKRKNLSACTLGVVLTIFSCTDLEEDYQANLTTQQATYDLLYPGLLTTLKSTFQNPTSGVIPLSELTTDELLSPTRVTDWEDNGSWRQLHQHAWNPDHTIIASCFNTLGGVVFSATELLQFSPTPEQEIAVRFYRAWAMYWLLDLFDQVPYRDPGESTLLPARVRKGIDAFDYIVNEINALLTDLPEGPSSQPNKNAARVLLMKCYLNKAVYANRQASQFDFNVADMNKVIGLADEVINSNQYQFSDRYFDNFAPNNTIIGYENIFTQENVGGAMPGSPLALYTLIPLHYSSTPYGFNGWATLSDFYDKFENSDKRRAEEYNHPNGPGNPGHRINAGFLVGQQYNLYDDSPLYDFDGSPLQFTREVHNIETEADYRRTGIRPQKYPLDYENFPHNPFNVALDNDWVYFRLPDVLLMKAEAIWRGGNPTSTGGYGGTALELVNSIRTHPSRGASALSNIDANVLLDERGRELWLECWRRQDLIRFHKFLEPFQEKDHTSDPKFTVFPIPSQQIAVNKNLTQNPGY